MTLGENTFNVLMTDFTDTIYSLIAILLFEDTFRTACFYIYLLFFLGSRPLMI